MMVANLIQYLFHAKKITKKNLTNSRYATTLIGGWVKLSREEAI